MLRFKAMDFVVLGEELEQLSGLLLDDEIDPKGADAKKTRSEIRDTFRRLIPMCDALELVTSVSLLQSGLNDIPATDQALEIYRKIIEAELETRLCFMVPSEFSDFYDKIIADAVLNSFPTSASELKRAYTCEAFSEHTAAVFHAMRALELIVQGLARKLKVQNVARSHWGNLLAELEREISRLRSAKTTKPKAVMLQRYSSALVQLGGFKDAWRNYVAHAKVSYDARQAKDVLKYTSDFMETLAPVFKE